MFELRPSSTVFLLTALLLLGVAACDEDDVPVDTIRGTVVDSDGQPVEGAAIMLCYDLLIADPGAKPQTGIEFIVPEPSHARAWVTESCHDATVRTLIDDDLVAGQFLVTWDGKNTEGDKVVPGVYIFNLVLGEETHTREMFLHEIGYAGHLTADGLESFAVTDADGKFSIDQNCLAFGYQGEGMDESGTIPSTFTIPHRATLWAIHDNHGAAAGPAKVTISPILGATVDITFGDTPPYGELRDFATLHWSVDRLDCAYDHDCADGNLAGAGIDYFLVNDYRNLVLWIDPVVDEAGFLDNIGRWSQFVFGWDDFLHPSQFMGDDYSPGDVAALNDPRCSAHREAYRLLLAGKAR